MSEVTSYRVSVHTSVLAHSPYRMRGGQRFGAEPILVPADHPKIKAILADDGLVCEEITPEVVETDPPDPPKNDPDPKGTAKPKQGSNSKTTKPKTSTK